MAKPIIHNPLKVGNDYGHVKFGHINPNNTYAGVLLRNGDPGKPSEHYTMFMSSGQMNGGTINRCPGVYQIHCGETPVTDTSFIVRASSGDIVLQAPLGRVRIEAQNIDLIANGKNNKNGFINIESNEKINIRSKNIEINGDSVCKFLSSGVCEIVGNGALNLFGGLIDCADSCTTLKPSKGVSLFEAQQKTGGFI
jgi:hypothetical protein